MAIVYVGIGSNLGDRYGNCNEAIKKIKAIAGSEVKKCSQFYETTPVGGPPQPDYINGVIEVETSIDPYELLRCFKGIERQMGRIQTELKNQPRLIDLDILLYGKIIIDSVELSIPHPEMKDRFFVLKGLVEISPSAVHPVGGETALELLKALKT